MEILEAQAALLSNYEVLTHLRSQREARAQVSHRLGRPIHAPENMQTIEFETIRFMEEHAIRKLEESKIASLMEFLLRYKLTKAEKLQIINILPTCEVEFHLIVEECEERFGVDEVTEILNTIREFTK